MNVECAEKLLPIYTTDKRFIDIYGGRGSAKSWGVADFCISKGLEKKRRFLCAREIQNSIKDSVHKLLSDRIEFHGLQRFYNITDKSITGVNGTEFIFKGLYRNINDIKSTEGIDIAWIEEAHSVSRESLKVLIPTIRQDKSQIIFTYNPTGEDDPVHVDFTLSDRSDVLRVEMNYDDNPWFPDVLRREMEYDRSHDYDKYRHVWLGKPVAHSDAQIFKGRWHVEEFIADDKTFFYFGSDFGFSQDPTTLIRCFVKDNKLYIDYEVYGVGIEINHIPAAYATIPLSNQFPIFGDSSRPDTISYLRNHGYPQISGVEKGKGSVEDGVEFIKSFDKIIIHPRCQHTIDEFRLYSYVTDKHTGLISNKIEDKNNHCFVGSTEILTIDGWKRIDKITIDDYVINRAGVKKVLHVFRNGVKNVSAYNILGHTLVSTNDHNVISDCGKKEISKIGPEDIIYKWSTSRCKLLKTINTKKSYLMAILIDAILTAQEERTGYILKDLKTVFLSICTGQYMNMLMGRLAIKNTYTTKTVTQITTKYQILRLLTIYRILVNMPLIIIQSIMTKSGAILTTLGTWHQNGIEAKKEENGTKLTRLNEHTPIMYANNAELNIPQPKKERIDSAQIIAKPKICEHVYDLMIEDQHEYIANGILVSNCMDSVRYALVKLIKQRRPMRLLTDRDINI